jgi:hypothetical protein
MITIEYECIIGNNKNICYFVLAPMLIRCIGKIALITLN